MSRLVADASVLAKLYFPEEFSERAEAALRAGRATLLAPDLVYAELASVAWKRRRRGEIDEKAALTIIAEALTLPIEVQQSGELIERALGLAIETGQTVYDCLYLAVAIAERAVLITADERLARAILAGPFAKYVRWIGAD